MKCDIPRLEPCKREAEFHFIPKNVIVYSFLKNKDARHRCARHKPWKHHFDEVSFEESVVAEVMLS